MPIKKGKFEIVGIVATVNDTTAASRLTLIDSDDFKVYPDASDIQWSHDRCTIFDQKGLANADATLGVIFPEPLKCNRGLALNSLSTNLVAGKTFVYVR
jgi:hypothetical protein